MATDDPAAALEAARCLMRGEASREEARTAVRALLLASAADRQRGVERSVSLSEIDPLSAAQSPDAYDAVLEGTFARFAEQRRREEEGEDGWAAARLAELIAALDSRPHEAVRAEVRDASSDHRWALATALGRASFTTGLADPPRAVVLAELAVTVASLAPVEEVGPVLANDLRADAAAHLGNALRIAGDLPAAADILGRAEDLRTKGTGDPIVLATVAGFRASLCREQRRFDRALSLCRRGGRAARRGGDSALRARALLNEATILYESGDAEAASRLLATALDRIDAATDEPRLALVARHNLIVYLDAQGHYDEARSRLGETRALAERLGHRLDLVRLGWLEGLLAISRGDPETAEQRFEVACDAFMELDAGYDAALVSLDLAALLADQGRPAEVRRMAAAMVPVFASRDIHREAQAALCLFQSAALAEQAGAELVREVRDYLERARGRPQLRFRAG